MTDLLLFGTLEDVLPVLLLDGISDADGLANDVDAAEDAAAGGDGEGEDCGLVSQISRRRLLALGVATERGVVHMPRRGVRKLL